MNYPIITICTLIYNTDPRYVIETIESIIKSEYPAIQHLIIDDCSPNPHSKKTVKEWISRNNYACEFHENEVNLGVTKTLNKALELAKGKYITGFSDDHIFPGKLHRDIQEFESSPATTAMVHSISQFMDENSKPIPLFYPTGSFPGTSRNAHSQLLEKNFVCAISSLCDVSALRAVGGYDERFLFEDYSLWLKLASANYTFSIRPIVDSMYRINPNGLSQTRRADLELDEVLCKIAYANQEHKSIIDKALKVYSYENSLSHPIRKAYIEKFNSRSFILGLRLKKPIYLLLKKLKGK